MTFVEEVIVYLLGTISFLTLIMGLAIKDIKVLALGTFMILSLIIISLSGLNYTKEQGTLGDEK